MSFAERGGKVGSRLGVGDELEAPFLERLAGACGSVDASAEVRAAAGRDWWPISLRWAHEGMTAAMPGVVARPSDTAEVCAVLALCNEARVPVTAVAGRSGVCGGSVPVFGGVALDMGAMAGIWRVDAESMVVDVAPGTYGDALERQLRADHGLTLGHWPQSIALSTVGGWLACRSAGQYSTRYGKIEDMVAGLEVVLADGTLVTTGGGGPRAATGPDLTQVFVGSEGTLGVITRASLRAHPDPPAELRAAYGFDSFTEGLDACRRVLRRGATPAVLRLYDTAESQRHFHTEATCVLIALDEGDLGLVQAVMDVVDSECRGPGGEGRLLDVGLVQQWVERRNDTSALAPLVKRGFVVDTIEVSGQWSVLTRLHADVADRLARVDGTLSVSAHESHAYSDGACLYFTFAGTRGDPADLPGAEAYYRDAWGAAMDATLAAGGSISHHHGIGLNRGPWLEAALGPAYGVLRCLKGALDPRGILNPGKLGLVSPFGEPPWR